MLLLKVDQIALMVQVKISPLSHHAANCKQL